MSMTRSAVAIVVVKRSTALHAWSSKANQGWPEERKGCPGLNPGNCLRVMFSFLGCYQLNQSTMVSYAFLSHPSSNCKYKRRERAMLNIQNSPRVQPLLVIFMDAIDLLWLLEDSAFGWQTLTSKTAELWGSQKPCSRMSNLASCAPLVPLLNCSSVMSWRTGSTSTSLHTILYVRVITASEICGTFHAYVCFHCKLLSEKGLNFSLRYLAGWFPGHYWNKS